MEVLQGLAQEGRTLILTIHQSRSDIFKHFGTVLLLARGGFPVYAGKGNDMLSHFHALGFPCPTTTNPADFALDLITIDLQKSSREEATRTTVRTLIDSWSSGDYMKAIIPTTINTPAELGSLVRKTSGFFSAYPILVHRASINFRRQPPLLAARIMQVVGLSIILALFFAPLKHDYYSVQTRFGFIQEFCAFYFVGMLQNVAIYPNEKDVFYRENDDGIYSVEAFFAQYVTLEIPFEIITSFIFAILTDLAAGLPRNATVFFVCFFNCFCIVNCGESLGIMVCSLHVYFTSLFYSNLTMEMARREIEREILTKSPVQHALLPHWLRRQSHQRLPLNRPIHVRHPLHRYAHLSPRHQLPVSDPLRHPQFGSIHLKRHPLYMHRCAAITLGGVPDRGWTSGVEIVQPG
jgi:hypothetical protein